GIYRVQASSGTYEIRVDPWSFEEGSTRRPQNRRGRTTDSEVLLVADVGHGAFVAVAVARRKRVLAAGDEVLGAHGELAAPRGAPGESDAEAFPAARVVGCVDHAADDVGGEVANAGADGQAPAAPAIGQCRHVAGRNQPRPRPGAADRHSGLAADVLLA